MYDISSRSRRPSHFVRRTIAALGGENAKVVSGLMAGAQLDATFAESFREGFLGRRRAALRTVLDDGRARGEIATGVDLDLLVDLVFGAIWYRLLSRHAPLNRRFADRLAEAIVALCGAAGSDRALREH